MTATVMGFLRLHHVQVCCPRGGEDSARTFYRDGLGLREVAKPAALVERGGLWFRSYDADGRVAAELHVGVEEPFAPAARAHPAFEVSSAAELHAVERRLSDLGFDVDASQRWTFDGFERVHALDPHGNRVELLARGVAGSSLTPTTLHSGD
jgi:catechol 2,3-dioxygenase-like lactoylglutathione lyase family enzyme